MILNETSDVISSPYNPRKYPDNHTCNWQITASQGNRIVLEIGPIDIESCGASGECTCDYLQVQNGFSVDPGASERICGSHQKIKYYSMHGSLNVMFVSDSSSSFLYVGFQATYKQLNYTPPLCPTEAIPLSGNGKLSSPNYPMSNYTASQNCTWVITVPVGKYVKFAFTDFVLGSCALDCSSESCTYVEVYNGASASSPSLGRFCKGSVLKERLSSGHQMFVKFHSGSTLDRGFEAQYSVSLVAPTPTRSSSPPPSPSPTIKTEISSTLPEKHCLPLQLLPLLTSVDVERNGAVLKLERKEFLSNGNRTSYTQIIVKQLEEEGQNIGTSTDQKYAAKYIVKDYENRVDGEPYITAEFNYDKGKESFTIGDEKYYSRSKSGSKKYLNGELDSGTNYAVFQRSFDAYRSYDSGSFIRFKTKKGFPWLTVLLVVILIVVLALALIAFACWLVKKKRRNRKVSSKTDNVEMNSAGSHGKLVNGAENHAADHNQNPMYETLHEKQAPAGGAVGNPTDGESVDSGQNADYEIPDEAPRQEGDYELIKEGSGAQEGHYQQLQLNSRTDYENFNTTL
ncbi:Bone morphogenetic protein 1 [Desmophyllum pertusum]|uniref:Bone morphogenetic protein 1 n=1 Tax=Desmophyllum pertusum TaxID=174260 RepID=A0A9W9Z6I6_9CNID|nr:Bone morphogenetic protein 1 [Desmophyllum pertusum]